MTVQERTEKRPSNSSTLVKESSSIQPVYLIQSVKGSGVYLGYSLLKKEGTGEGEGIRRNDFLTAGE